MRPQSKVNIKTYAKGAFETRMLSQWNKGEVRLIVSRLLVKSEYFK